MLFHDRLHDHEPPDEASWIDFPLAYSPIPQTAARRTAKGKDVKPESRISSKSGYDRKIENKKREAREAAKKRASTVVGGGSDAESAFEGFE